SHMYLQVKPGGDIAAIMGLCKHVIAVHEERLAAGRDGVIDTRFIAEHTNGYADFVEHTRATNWDEIERVSGLDRADLEAAAEVYI
ncbi:hypothetical protein ABTM58_20395, partial [Acinetobacter baumannii]